MNLSRRVTKVSLTPVITAPLDQLRDTTRKDSRTAVKPMTAAGDSVSTVSTGQQLLETSLQQLTLDL